MRAGADEVAAGVGECAYLACISKAVLAAAANSGGKSWDSQLQLGMGQVNLVIVMRIGLSDRKLSESLEDRSILMACAV